MRQAARTLTAFVGIGLLYPAGTRELSSLAVPETIVFSGGPLQGRVALTDRKENYRFIGALARRDVAWDTAGRTHIDVAVFYVRSQQWTKLPIDSIPLSMADARSRYYPAVGKRPAMWVPTLALSGNGFPTAIIRESGLQVLAKHGIPIRTP